jgi:hypothetical protein
LKAWVVKEAWVLHLSSFHQGWGVGVGAMLSSLRQALGGIHFCMTSDGNRALIFVV